MDTNERLHKEWIGMAQPEGLVITTAALKAAEANITWPVTELQVALKEMAGEGRVVLDQRAFMREILGWSDEFVVARDKLPEALRVNLDGGEVLAPNFAVRSADDENVFVLLVGLPAKSNAPLDAASDDPRWTATPHQKFERLLRDTGVHVGLLMNGRVFRLVYAPKGESAGWIDFQLENLLRVDGRELLGAMHMLLNERRLVAMEPAEPGRPGKRLADLLKASREYQNTVSVALREQILDALRELLRGFEHADQVAGGKILGELRRGNLQGMYAGLVTVLMRMVFVLFAEERGLLPMERDLYASSYSLTKLYAQLLEDRDRFGDGLDDRFGGWARVITLFRMLHDGVRTADGFVLPARKGDFFNPDAFPFLEGRLPASVRQYGEVLELPRIGDGVVFRVLQQLLVLGAERLQYKGLDVEQIGSVYEGLMGFDLEVAEGPSLCVTPEHVVMNLGELLRRPGADRLKTLKADAALDLKDKAASEVKGAESVEALHAALSRRISSRQPGLIPTGSLYLQPGQERRKSGSHYTPKSLTAPIVETTLRPIFERLGASVTPAQILDLKVCDPAMGGGAFLVEACRQLADQLVLAWRRTGTMPDLPKDEDPLLHARRLIAQRCLYGVDKNPLAVDLARLSMWLVTFAKDHPFTFVDHALRCGDSLVGLTREQIVSMSLDVSAGTQIAVTRPAVEEAVKRAEQLRHEIHAIGDPPDTAKLADLWRQANDALVKARMLGDLVVAAFFSEDSDKARRKAVARVAEQAAGWLETGAHDAALRG
ncbi:MAG: BREX-1 system adenine-specific DNA-methyltransferase PglX, partial [Myxococcota bacterium]|nr:BREX-1 system adenine-specific DNA-methyltransferase PglX [Myxococcota bacterium]